MSSSDDLYKPLAGASNDSSKSQQVFVLHPLPLLNISDYYTRSKSSSQPLIGGLMGQRNYKQVTVYLAFELLLKGDNVVDDKYLAKKLELYSQTFPQYEFVGWFHVLPKGLMQPVNLTLNYHQQIAELVDNPTLLIVGPQDIAEASGLGAARNATDSDKMMTDDEETKPTSAEEEPQVTADLPLKAFESVHKDQKLEFVELPPVLIETSEAERIAVDDIKGTQDGDKQDLSNSLSNQRNAVRMFHQRLKVVNDYLLTVRASQQKSENQTCDKGKKTSTAAAVRNLDDKDYALLRKINAFASELSKQRAADFSDAAQKQQLDVVVTALLSTVVKGEFMKLEANTVWASQRSFENIQEN